MIRFIFILLGCFLFFQTSWAQGTWNKKASLPEPRERAVAFGIGNFGYVGTGSSGFYERNFWKYDPQIDRWEGIASMPTLARIGAFSFVINGKGYVGGGVNENSQSDTEFWVYDPITNQWSRKADIPEPGGFETLTSFSIENRGYYLTTYRIDKFWEYDPETNVWIKKVNFPGLGRMDQVGFSIGTKGYIGTGFAGSENGGNTAEFWEYDPFTDKWTKKQNVPGNPRTQAVGFSIGNSGFVGLGTNRGILQKDFWEYHPETDSWTEIVSCGYAAFDAIAMNIGSKGYVGTGIGTSGGDFWEYTPDLSSVNTIKQSDFVRLYPNPVSIQLNLETSEPGPVTFSIVTAHGQSIKTGQATDNVISVTDLPKGVYFLRILSMNNSLIAKFIKE